MGFVFQKSYERSLSKKWYVASTLPIYTHSQAPSSRAAYADMQKADQKGAGLHPAESVGWGYDSPCSVRVHDVCIMSTLTR